MPGPFGGMSIPAFNNQVLGILGSMCSVGSRQAGALLSALNLEGKLQWFFLMAVALFDGACRCFNPKP